MKKINENTSTSANVLKAAIAAVFAVVLGIAINFLHTDEKDTTTSAFTANLETFKGHVTSSHWQWRVRQPTTMIMLIHYDKTGKETNRTPVRMNHNGWPTADLSNEGCEKIWTSLVGGPLRVDGFKVHANYYAELDDDEDNYWCRYGLSRGAYFDYFPASGFVTNLSD
ncbi:hypothetical protein [Alteromonas gracilis]|uniref:hypothetical protein n=1 Tax=Alteromonas gracilis TaxID=1479524 RepID=UPI003734DC39